jgi:hypothetical protein
MPRDVDRFLNRAPILEEGPSLGRVYAVRQETWLLSEDPRTVAPRVQQLAGRLTALLAADLARESAEGFDRHGFHKPSGSWWASDGARFHRFVVRPGPTHGALTVIAASGLGALAAFAVLGLARNGRRSSRA